MSSSAKSSTVTFAALPSALQDVEINKARSTASNKSAMERLGKRPIEIIQSTTSKKELGSENSIRRSWGVMGELAVEHFEVIKEGLELGDPLTNDEKIHLKTLKAMIAHLKGVSAKEITDQDVIVEGEKAIEQWKGGKVLVPSSLGALEKTVTGQTDSIRRSWGVMGELAVEHFEVIKEGLESGDPLTNDENMHLKTLKEMIAKAKGVSEKEIADQDVIAEGEKVIEYWKIK